jgi:hypothetical protein
MKGGARGKGGFMSMRGSWSLRGARGKGGSRSVRGSWGMGVTKGLILYSNVAKTISYVNE